MFIERRTKMQKVITISNQKYTIKSSAWTQFKYKNDTGRNLLSDLQALQKKIEGKSESELIASLDDMLGVLMRITYNLIEEAGDDKVKSYEDFLKNVDDLFSDTQWLIDTLEVAIAPLSGGTKTPFPQIKQ